MLFRSLRLPGRDKDKDKNKNQRELEGRREISWIWLAPWREGDKDAAMGDEYSIGEFSMDCIVPCHRLDQSPS